MILSKNFISSFTLKGLIVDSVEVSVLTELILGPVVVAVVIVVPLGAVGLVALAAGFLSIERNSAEEIFTFEAEAVDDFAPVAAEAKLPVNLSEKKDKGNREKKELK